MRRVVRWLCMAIIAVLGTGCSQRAAPLTHDAYIWQRQWTPALRDAVAGSSDLVRAWRVLVAQADADGSFSSFRVDRDALSRSGRPVVIVIRIDGRLATFDEAALIARIVDVTQAWPSAAGLEIDYDCPTRRLLAYAHFLQVMKARLGRTPLSITALPAWLSSPDLDRLLDVPDEAVLQVHAVQAPQAGLFNADVAMGWVDDFSRRTRKPFRVALPTYGSRVSWRADGSLLGVESEASTLSVGSAANELYAAPDILTDVVRRLQRNRPRRLAGVAWFRLPTRDDSRAWSLATWRGVVTGNFDATPLRAHLLPSASTGAPFDVVIENPGSMDAAPAYAVDLPATCDSADGINGYVLKRSAQFTSLKLASARALSAGSQRHVGWARCAPGTSPTLNIRTREILSS